ncbi:MAG: YIP1 family protein [Deltaproteobacteria bacterium]|nr:YIP1 family protein [Deltaproteobacteria bacterium]MBW2123317.1 YIP1 family protein [Deltaproteobacteria bacterium]
MHGSNQSEPACRVVLLGPASESSREKLILGLQQRFRLTPRQAESLVQRAPTVVKRGISLEKAQSFAYHLEQIGARVRIDRVFHEEEAPAPQGGKPEPEEGVPPGSSRISTEPRCPWEEMDDLGFLRALFGTIGEVLFHPSRFYSRMPIGKGLLHPLIFAIVMGVLGGLIGLVYEFLMMLLLGRIFQPQGLGNFGVPVLIASAIGLPLLTIIYVFVGSGILHVCLMIVRGNRKGFEATFRVVAYAMSTQILAVVPLLGGIAGTIWTPVIQIIGLRESHEISSGRAAFAIFLPLLVLLGFVVAIFLIMIPIIFKSPGVTLRF